MPALDEAVTVIQTLRDYYAASNKQDVQGMVSYYHEPVLFISPRGVAARATRADASRVLAEFIERLRAIGAARSEWAESHVKQLSDTLAVAGIVVARYGADEQELERVGWTYLLHKTDGAWKIAVLASHPPDAVLRVD
jgi:ketosteroid isomerase-like protein